ncbi:MAG TPA: glycosyltransferase family A protein [Acidimicrobiia bacterium]|nr:glycosyltransferase family A protein [Acidimicrobiia bacterium]
MTTRRPFLSVIVPVYNDARHLPEAIASIESQGYEPLEIIVVDDGSTDDTPQVLERLGDRVRVRHQVNKGPAAARNRGLEAAQGELVAFCDADDRWPDGKLDLQVGRLLRDPALDVVLGRVQYQAEEGVPYPEVPFEDPDLHVIMHVHLGSGVYRRPVFDRVGPFDESFTFSEDVDWFIRARELGVSIRILRDVTLYYRIHRGNMTRGVTFIDFQLMPVLKKSLDRRKAAGNAGVNFTLWRDLDDAYDESAVPGHPTVTVIIPVFDDTRYLEAAIDSALAQTHKPYEIIVIDDGSEETVVLPRRYPNIVLLGRTPHRGQGAARNAAVARAHGEILAFLDSDDVWLPDKLALQVAALEHDGADMVFGDVEEFVSPDLVVPPGTVPPVVARRGGTPTSFAVRTRAFRRVGPFREDITIGEFIDWYSRAVEIGLREAEVDAVVARRRIHDRNTGILARDLRTQYAHVLKDALDRRRAGT